MDRHQFSNMDFEYQNGTGPMDERSPFAQIGRHSQRNNNSSNSNNGGGDKKRSFSVFGSPNKSTFPSLREPASQPHFFSSPKPLPALPPSMRNNPLFSTPRKLDVDDFASSGGETPKSPERNDVDSDATPDMSIRSSNFSRFDAMTKPSLASTKNPPVFTAGGKKEREIKDKDKETSPSRRQSWWRGLSNLASSPRASKDDYAHGAERKIMKRRSKEQKAIISRRDSVSDDEGAAEPAAPEPEKRHRQAPTTRKVSARQDKSLQLPPSPSPVSTMPSSLQSQQQPHSQQNDPNKPHWTFTFFEFITAHPTLPHVLSFYAQLALNIFLIMGIMYLFYSFWSTIRSDVDKKASIAAYEVLTQISACAADYTKNFCDQAHRAPALENACNNWASCMNQDPKNIGRARISAHAFAEIFNSFIEPISYKAMFFSILFVVGSIAGTNFAFGVFRDKAAAAHASAQQHHHYYNNALPAQTPQQQYNAALDWGSLQQGGQNVLEPAPSQYADREASPVRRLMY